MLMSELVTEVARNWDFGAEVPSQNMPNTQSALSLLSCAR
jgi:hypothetical protein